MAVTQTRASTIPTCSIKHIAHGYALLCLLGLCIDLDSLCTAKLKPYPLIQTMTNSHPSTNLNQDLRNYIFPQLLRVLFLMWSTSPDKVSVYGIVPKEVTKTSTHTCTDAGTHHLSETHYISFSSHCITSQN